MIPRLKPDFDIKEIKAIISRTKDPQNKFESRFATKFNSKYGVFFKYGRTALYAFLKVNSIKDKEVILPAYTCVVVAEAIVHSGNVPVFVDSHKGDFNMNLKSLERSITKNTRAIVATNIFGYPMDFKSLYRIVKKKEKEFGTRIFIIQDCAHSFDAQYDSESVVGKGIVTIFGLNISKIITTVVGGMIITDDKDQYDKIIKFRESHQKKISKFRSLKHMIYFLLTYPTFNRHLYGIANLLERSRVLDKLTKYYNPDKIQMPEDYDESVPDWFFRVGLEQIKKYDRIVAHRRKVSDIYFKELRDVKRITLPPKVKGCTYSHFTILVKNRDKMLKKALSKGIQLGWLIEYSVPLMRPYKKFIKSKEEFEISRYYSKHSVNLPVHMGMDVESIRNVVRFLKQYRD